MVHLQPACLLLGCLHSQKASSVPYMTTSGGNGSAEDMRDIHCRLDGKRLYVTNSLFSPWDKQFYPEMEQKGGYLLQVPCSAIKSSSVENS